ncbi:MAG: tetratricopeptide repeat protein [Halioglobus sp.]
MATYSIVLPSLASAVPLKAQEKNRASASSMLAGVFGIALMLTFCSGALAHAGHDAQLQRINDAIAQAPSSQSHYIERAALHTEAHRFTEAAADFKRADTLGASVAADYHRALLYEARKEYEAARASLSRYLKHFPNAPQAYAARARIAQLLGDKVAAIEDLRSNLRLMPQPNPGDFITAAKLINEQGSPGDALTLLDQGLEQLGVIPSIQREAIAIERQRQNIPAAIARLETLRVPLRESARWKLQMAELLSSHGDNESASALLESLTSDLQKKRPTPANQRLLQEARSLLATQIAGPK